MDSRGGPKYDGGSSRMRPTGTMVGNYRLGEKIDESRTGIVYRAVDTKMGRAAALKFLHPDLTSDSKARGRFIHEARSASSLGHPNICVIFQIDETRGGETFIAMPYYEGERLSRRLARGPLGLEEALEIAGQIAQGLSRAHARGIVHRGIQPANIFITQDGLVKILDFGLARLAAEAGFETAAATTASVRYLSPEQVRGDEADERSDIWALGAVLYEMVAGTPPFDAQRPEDALRAIASKEPVRLASRRPGIPVELEKIVERALAKAPADRYQHIEDLMVDIKRLAKGVALMSAGSRVLGAAAGPTLHRPSGRRALLLPLIALIAGIVLIVTATLLLRRGAKRAEPPAQNASEVVAPHDS